MRVSDQELIRAYLRVGVSLDRVAVFTANRRALLRELHLNGTEQDGEEDELIWRLFGLRKNGELPRLGTTEN